MALLPKEHLESVVAIGIHPAKGDLKWIATGFIFAKLLKLNENGTGDYKTFLVSNRHVFDKRDHLVLRFDKSTGGTVQFNVPLKKPDGTDVWFGHADPNIDVAVLPINPQFLQSNGGKLSMIRSNEGSLLIDSTEAKNLSEGDGIFLVGFPMGLVDQVENLAIVRSGNIARIRDCLSGRSPSFLINAQTYPGNSGGPVFLKPEIVSIHGTTAIAKAYLLGIVAAYIPYRDVAISQQTGNPRIIFEENSGISIVFTVDKIIETMDTSLVDLSRFTEVNPIKTSG